MPIQAWRNSWSRLCSAVRGWTKTLSRALESKCPRGATLKLQNSKVFKGTAGAPTYCASNSPEIATIGRQIEKDVAKR